MMAITRAVIVVVTGALLYFQTPARGQYPPEFNEFIALVPGLFDNVAQFNDDIARHLPVKQRHQRVTTSLKQENIPFLSKRRNFYVEQYLNGNPSDLTRQRIYSFGIDPYTLAMNLQLYQLKNASNFIHARTNDSAFSILTQDDVIYAQGCDMYWYKAEGNQTLFGSWMKKTCYITVSDEKVLVVNSNNLTSSYLTDYEQWYLSNGTEILGQPSPYNMTRQKSRLSPQ